MDITLSGSDVASDSYAIVRDEVIKSGKRIIKALLKELKVMENSFNTSGPENVAMILTEGQFQDFYFLQESQELVEKTIEAMEKRIANIGDLEDWDWDKANRAIHLNRYRELLRKLKKKLKSLPKTDEEWEELHYIY